MKKIDEILNGVSCMAIAGHVRPDGDCIGSCLGLYQYLRDNRPEIQADVYLEDPRPEFSYLPGFSEVKTSCEEKAYDLVVLLDVSSEERIGGINGGAWSTTDLAEPSRAIERRIPSHTVETLADAVGSSRPTSLCA